MYVYVNCINNSWSIDILKIVYKKTIILFVDVIRFYVIV